jgi:hypothetical protein
MRIQATAVLYITLLLIAVALFLALVLLPDDRNRAEADTENAPPSVVAYMPSVMSSFVLS